MKDYKLNIMEKDVLVETASICAGNVSTVLSNLVGKEIDLKVSEADIFPIEKIPELIEKGEKLVVGPKMLVVQIIAPLTGTLHGNMITLFPKDNAMLLLDLIKKQELGTTKSLGTKEITIFKKLGDDLLSIYTREIGIFLDIKIKKGASKITSTFGESIMDFALSQIHRETKQVLILRTDFSIMKEIKGSFLILLALKSLDDFLKILKKKVRRIE